MPMKNLKETKGPLRKVIGRVDVRIDTGTTLVMELYECGHTRLPVQDMIGPTNAYRRRCIYCRIGQAPDPKYVKMAQEWDSQ